MTAIGLIISSIIAQPHRWGAYNVKTPEVVASEVTSTHSTGNTMGQSTHSTSFGGER